MSMYVVMAVFARVVFEAPVFVMHSRDVRHGCITQNRHVQISIFASEPVYEFAGDSIQAIGADIEKFSTLTSERYSVRLKITAPIGQPISVCIKDKAAKKIGASEHDAVHNESNYSTFSKAFVFYFVRKKM